MSTDRKSEVTYIMIKPDGVQRNLVGKIVSRFEEKGYKLLAMKLMRPSREQFELHYADLAGRSFFPGLVAYMVRRPPRAPVCVRPSFPHGCGVRVIDPLPPPRSTWGCLLHLAFPVVPSLLPFLFVDPSLPLGCDGFSFPSLSCVCPLDPLSPLQLSGPVVGMVWQGADAVAGGRRLLGATKPSDSAPGTIRGDFAIDVGRCVLPPCSPSLWLPMCLT